MSAEAPGHYLIATIGGEDAAAKAVDTQDSEWTKTATVRDPQGAEFVLSQFTPPGG
jgi:uncharacterized protein